MKKIKHLAQIAVLTLGSIVMHQALAHGDAKPRHGGIVQVANDLTFELVAEADGATLYVVDHDQPMASKGMSGKLTVLQGSHKAEAELREAGDNRLRAVGVKIAKGDKVVAVLNNVKGKTTTIRFAVR